MQTPHPDTPPPDSVIVVGTGLAGLRTASALRTAGFTGELTIIGTEPHLPYDRPPLSKKLLTHNEPVFFHDDLGVLLQDLTPNVFVGHTVTDLSFTVDSSGSTRAQVTTLKTLVEGDRSTKQESKILSADAVVLAVGSAPVAPPHWNGTHKLYTWDDAVSLRSAFSRKESQDVVIIGAGWIGAELATVAASGGHNVTVIESQDTALATQLGQKMGTALEPWYQHFGVELRTATSVASVQFGPNIKRLVTLASGEVLTADLVITAVGARPATTWLPPDLPRSVTGALSANQWGQVDVPGYPQAQLFAVGDCAERQDAVFSSVPGGHWNTALQDPDRVAAALTRSWQLPRAQAPQVFSTQLGHEINLFGLPNVETDEVLIRPSVSNTSTSDASSADPSASNTFDPHADWVGFYVASGTSLPAGRGRVTGIFTVDSPRLASQARKLMANGPVELDLTKALDPSVQLRTAK